MGDEDIDDEIEVPVLMDEDLDELTTAPPFDDKMGLVMTGRHGESRAPPCLVSRSGWSWLSASPQVPDVLQVTSPNFQHECCGSYRLIDGLRANGEHVWIQQISSMKEQQHHIYSGRSGRWCIGAEDISDRRFCCNAGFIYHKEIHRGMSPHQLEAGQWAVWDGSQFRLDPSITITATHSVRYASGQEDMFFV
jgi:hypothetical protein